MYYVIELKQSNEIKILKNFLKDGHKMVCLQQIFKENNIKLVEDGYNIDEAGLYCVKCGLDTYRLFRLITEADGYLFYGRKYEVDVSYLKIVYYVNELDGLEGVGEQLKQLGLKEKVEDDEKKEKVRKQRKKEQEVRGILPL